MPLWTFVFLHQKQKTKGMEHQKTSYDTLPERIDYLIQEISEIKNIHDKQNRKKGRNTKVAE